MTISTSRNGTRFDLAIADQAQARSAIALSLSAATTNVLLDPDDQADSAVFSNPIRVTLGGSPALASIETIILGWDAATQVIVSVAPDNSQLEERVFALLEPDFDVWSVRDTLVSDEPADGDAGFGRWMLHEQLALFYSE